MYCPSDDVFTVELKRVGRDMKRRTELFVKDQQDRYVMGRRRFIEWRGRDNINLTESRAVEEVNRIC